MESQIDMFSCLIDDFVKDGPLAQHLTQSEFQFSEARR